MTTNNPTTEEVRNAILTIANSGLKIIEKLSSGMNKGIKRYSLKHKNIQTQIQTGGALTDIPPEDKNLGISAVIVRNVRDLINISIKKYIQFITNGFINAVDSVSGNVLEKSVTELVPQLNNKIIILAKQLDMITEQKDYLDNVEYLSEVVTEIALDFLHAMEPKVNEIVDELIKSNREIGEKSAAGAVSIGIGMFKSAVSAIPFFGFFINGFLLLGTILNELMGITNKSVDTGIKTYKKVDKMKNEAKDIYTEKKLKLDDATKRFTQPIQPAQLTQPSSTTITNPVKVGGSSITRNSIEEKVNSFLNKNKTTIMEYLSSLKTHNGNLDYGVFLKGIPDTLQKIISHYETSYSNHKNKLFVGGVKEKRYQINKSIHKTTRRLLKSINRFNGKIKNKSHKSKLN